MTKGLDIWGDEMNEVRAFHLKRSIEAKRQKEALEAKNKQSSRKK